MCIRDSNYFYVAIQYNPVEIANNLRRNNGSIPGFRPGTPTSDFITRPLNKITLIGAIFLAAVAVLPIILGNLTGMSIQPVSYTHLPGAAPPRSSPNSLVTPLPSTTAASMCLCM